MTPLYRNPLFLDCAGHIARQLCRDAVWAGPRCNWLGWTMTYHAQRWQPAYRAQNANLYDGVAGIALFLSEFLLLTPELGHNALERATTRGAVTQLRNAAGQLQPNQFLGFHAGLAGIAHALFRAAEALEDDTLIEDSLMLLSRVADAPLAGAGTDIIGGVAGSISTLLDAGRRFQRQDLTEAALHMGDHLLRTAVVSDRGSSWPSQMPGEPSLLGYGHGAGGIASSLLELALLDGGERFRRTAEEALRYERSFFSSAHKNWPDFRSARLGSLTPAEPTYPVAWCHGAPGIGLCRLRVHDLIADPECLTEIDAALQTTLASLPSLMTSGHGNFSLCHGIAGNADFLLEAFLRDDRPELYQCAEEAAQFGIDRYLKPGIPWPCGIEGAGEAPNLMLGLAGIGYLYLRLYSPATVPGVLLLPSAVRQAAQAQAQPRPGSSSQQEELAGQTAIR